MTNFLCKLFVKDRENVKDPVVRRAYGTMVSVVGIMLNILLSAGKFIVGTLAGSISITADALNNISDAGAQIISLVSFKISAKPADRDHPFGHARMEYVASMIVSFIVLLIGAELFKTSLEKIFNPEPAEFGFAAIGVLVASIICKLWLCLFNRKVGAKIDSQVMRATAADSLSDVVATSAVLASTLISKFSGLQTDAYMGLAVSVFIFIAGIKILNETKNSILGGAPDPEVVKGITELVKNYPDILGVHDMVVHNYGPGNTIASLHAEVDGSKDVFYTHDVIDTVEKKIFSELGVHATIHMDPIVTDDERVRNLRMQVADTVTKIDGRLKIHDFRYVHGTTHSNLIFDIAVPFEIKMTDDEIKRAVSTAVSNIDPSYFTVLTIDRE